MGEWLAAMPAAVARQRALLERMVAVVAAEPATTGLVLGCSLARGAGDRWSDVDARHLFAQYADGLQLSLVVRPAGEWQGRAPTPTTCGSGPSSAGSRWPTW